MSSGRTPPAALRNPLPGGNGDCQEDQEPDETTGIVTRGPDHRALPPAMNYQSTAEAAGPRPRRSRNGNASRGNAQNGSGSGSGSGTPEEVAGQEARHESKEEKWWSKTVAKFQSIELENKGSVARDHLALERTFLAWLRTSLAFASIGVAITQLFRLNTSLADGEDPNANPNVHTLRHLGKPLGAVFLAVSILILFLGYHRYFQAQQWIIKGKFPASRGTVILVSMVALVLMIISLVVVVVVQPSTDD